MVCNNTQRNMELSCRFQIALKRNMNHLGNICEALKKYMHFLEGSISLPLKKYAFLEEVSYHLKRSPLPPPG